MYTLHATHAHVPLPHVRRLALVLLGHLRRPVPPLATKRPRVSTPTPTGSRNPRQNTSCIPADLDLSLTPSDVPASLQTDCYLVPDPVPSTRPVQLPVGSVPSLRSRPGAPLPHPCSRGTSGSLRRIRGLGHREQEMGKERREQTGKSS